MSLAKARDRSIVAGVLTSKKGRTHFVDASFLDRADSIFVEMLQLRVTKRRFARRIFVAVAVAIVEISAAQKARLALERGRSGNEYPENYDPRPKHCPNMVRKNGLQCDAASNLFFICKPQSIDFCSGVSPRPKLFQLFSQPALFD